MLGKLRQQVAYLRQKQLFEGRIGIPARAEHTHTIMGSAAGLKVI
jgi:hypothetical protein